MKITCLSNCSPEPSWVTKTDFGLRQQTHEMEVLSLCVDLKCLFLIFSIQS